MKNGVFDIHEFTSIVQIDKILQSLPKTTMSTRYIARQLVEKGVWVRRTGRVKHLHERGYSGTVYTRYYCSECNCSIDDPRYRFCHNCGVSLIQD